ncbi:MAG TPA: hypothetical protein VG826_02235 [Pirellulales bacterium]|nr:hypothetical protein [Pirellulales bacterium]
MNATNDRAGGRRLEALSLTLLTVLAVVAAVVFPARKRDVSLRERDLVVYFQAHQLFQRDPEQLSETQLDDVKRWCRCLQLAARHETSGLESLDDDERQFVVRTLHAFCPDLDELPGYRRIYDSCRAGLNAGVPPTVATKRELRSHGRPVLLE